MSNNTTVTLSQIESHLWESANILRGPVDAADFKTYIFPLLFFKRICDVWDDEYQEIVDETGDEQLAWFPESHRFQIPEDCHWNDVRGKATCRMPSFQKTIVFRSPKARTGMTCARRLKTSAQPFSAPCVPLSRPTPTCSMAS